MLSPLERNGAESANGLASASAPKRIPRSETAVMLVTVVAVVLTHNLAIGVIIGVIAAMVRFARRVAHLGPRAAER